MDVLAFYAWVKGTWLSQYMMTSVWAFTLCETLHFIGLCVLLGGLIVVDLRLLGMMKSTPARVVLKFLPIAIGGFVLNLATGVCFFAFNPQSYSENWMFWLKMGLVALAGLNALFFTVVEHKQILETPAGATFDVKTRISAGLSLALWVGVIIAGRLLPVTQGIHGTG